MENTISTSIFTTGKLEKTISKFIEQNVNPVNPYLGKWNATLFTISRKKCWVLINEKTKYMLLLSDVKQADLKNIDRLFKETLYSQFIYDGIIVDYSFVEKIIGRVSLHKTDNDKSANGALNNRMLFLGDWKYEFGSFDNFPFRDINNRMNTLPGKMLDYRTPVEEMEILIRTF